MPQTMLVINLPPAVVRLGLAGILPQLGCLSLVLLPGGWSGVGLAAGCFYAALILSFLGGMWWMQALVHRVTTPGPYLVAVVPSLAGWAALVPWALGWAWPGPSLLGLGVLLLVSPLVDWFLAETLPLPRMWMLLRLAMAAGLGSLTLALAFAALTV